jgi:hypothetical protein
VLAVVADRCGLDQAEGLVPHGGAGEAGSRWPGQAATQTAAWAGERAVGAGRVHALQVLYLARG